MKRNLLFALIGLALPALIAPGFIAPAWAAHWNVDMGKSKLGFTLPWGKEPFIASFKNWQANIDFDPNDLAHAHVEATITIASENSDDPDTDGQLKGDQGFASGKFPTAHFETKTFQHLTGNNYAADGILTIRGVTKPVHMPFTLVMNGASAHMVGDVQTKWADYGLGQELGQEMPDMGQIVTIHVDLTAVKA